MLCAAAGSTTYVRMEAFFNGTVQSEAQFYRFFNYMSHKIAARLARIRN
jgi:hypothetical protein